MEIWTLPRYFFYDAWREIPKCNKPQQLLHFRKGRAPLPKGLQAGVNIPAVQEETRNDRIQSATVDAAPTQNDQESSKPCGNSDADQAAPSKETEWKAAEEAVAAYALAVYKAKLGQGQVPEALSLELLSTVSPAYPLARLSFNLASLSQIWKFSICRWIVGWVAEGWAAEDIYERVTWKAWDYQKATTSVAARLLAKVFKFIGKDHPIRREHEKWILLASTPFWESSLHMAVLKGYEHLLVKKQGRLHRVHPETIDGILTAKFVQQEAPLRLPSTDFNLLPEVHEQISALFPDERKEEQKATDNPSSGEKSKMLVPYSARGHQPPMEELMDILPEPSELARKLFTGGWPSPNVANNMARPVTAVSVKLEIRLPHINEQGTPEEVRPFWLASDPAAMIHNAFKIMTTEETASVPPR
eukprot:s56_g31.t1